MKIAVDAMGGDFAPAAVVTGALDAARRLQGIDRLVLVGDETAIRRELDSQRGGVPKTIEVYHASEVIGMDEAPVHAVRRKKDSSINRAIDLVKSGEAQGMISAGNTGAVVAAATLKLRTLAGIDRPAIATVMPTPRKPFVLIDAGANTDCSARMLVQFAIMGALYAGEILKCEKPLVGLMNVGTEDGKGNDTTKEAFKMLHETPAVNFRGNIEGHDLFKGEINVAVCDGFVGNVILKTSESVAHAVGHWIKQEFRSNPVRLLGTALLSGALRNLRTNMNPEMYGGAPLLGVNGVCTISHGASSPRAIFHAIRVTRDSVKLNLNEHIIRTVGEGHVSQTRQ
ncbi:MAG: phosphate acyltransferase PlsX [Kiritimatiellia bacterium]|jgi:glycerol-3-phosphate acyltransferase PlsX